MRLSPINPLTCLSRCHLWLLSWAPPRMQLFCHSRYSCCRLLPKLSQFSGEYYLTGKCDHTNSHKCSCACLISWGRKQQCQVSWILTIYTHSCIHLFSHYSLLGRNSPLFSFSWISSELLSFQLLVASTLLFFTQLQYTFSHLLISVWTQYGIVSSPAFCGL